MSNVPQWLARHSRPGAISPVTKKQLGPLGDVVDDPRVSDVLRGVAAGEPCDMALQILRQEEVSLRSCELESGGVRLEVVVPTTLGDTVVRARAMVINGGVKTNVVYRDPR